MISRFSTTSSGRRRRAHSVLLRQSTPESATTRTRLPPHFITAPSDDALPAINRGRCRVGFSTGVHLQSPRSAVVIDFDRPGRCGGVQTATGTVFIVRVRLRFSRFAFSVVHRSSYTLFSRFSFAIFQPVSAVNRRQVFRRTVSFHSIFAFALTTTVYNKRVTYELRACLITSFSTIQSVVANFQN